MSEDYLTPNQRITKDLERACLQAIYDDPCVSKDPAFFTLLPIVRAVIRTVFAEQDKEQDGAR